jgi:hypothetical protein
VKILQTLQGVGNTESTMLLMIKCTRNPQQTKNTKQNFRHLNLLCYYNVQHCTYIATFSTNTLLYFQESKQIYVSSGIVVRHTYVYKRKHREISERENIYLFIQNVQYKGVPYIGMLFYVFL